MRLEPVWRCANWANCQVRQQFGGTRCFFRTGKCEHLLADFSPAGKEMEVIVRTRPWGGSLGVTLPKRAVTRLGIRPGDELRLLVFRLHSVASMPVGRPGT